MFLEAKDNVKFLTTLERHFKVTPSINRIKEFFVFILFAKFARVDTTGFNKPCTTSVDLVSISSTFYSIPFYNQSQSVTLSWQANPLLSKKSP